MPEVFRDDLPMPVEATDPHLRLVKEPAKPRLFVMMHRVDRNGGQERSTFEYLTRLARLGWAIEIMSFSMADWPTDLEVKWQRAPGRWIPIQLIKNLWFEIYAWYQLIVKGKARGALRLTTGTASWLADVRVIQFVHNSFYRLMLRGDMPPPNPRSYWHRSYQYIFSWWNSVLERVILCRCKLLVAISRSVKDDLDRLFGEQAPPIEVIHHAPEDAKALRAESTIPAEVAALKRPGEPVIVFVGAMERKGIGKALAALATCKDLPWRFFVVGGGDIERWRKEARALEIEDRVHFFGEQPAHPYFAAADIFLFPSYYEPFGLVVSEAAAHGLALLVSRECGAMELWPKRGDWLQISARAPASSWGTSLRRLLVDPKLTQRTGSEARDAFRRWSWEQAAVRYDAVLKRLL